MGKTCLHFASIYLTIPCSQPRFELKSGCDQGRPCLDHDAARAAKKDGRENGYRTFRFIFSGCARLALLNRRRGKDHESSSVPRIHPWDRLHSPALAPLPAGADAEEQDPSQASGLHAVAGRPTSPCRMTIRHPSKQPGAILPGCHRFRSMIPGSKQDHSTRAMIRVLAAEYSEYLTKISPLPLKVRFFVTI